MNQGKYYLAVIAAAGMMAAWPVTAKAEIVGQAAAETVEQEYQAEIFEEQMGAAGYMLEEGGQLPEAGEDESQTDENSCETENQLSEASQYSEDETVDEDEDGEAAEDQETVEEEQAADAQTPETSDEAAEASAARRQQLVEYALQFVGGKYIYGGTDPHVGADCSGFTRYVLSHSAGVSVSHSSRSQSREGSEINASQMRPGDLIFYGSRKNIDHVAMYIGDSQIVHASTEKTGIKISKWDYQKPIKIVNVLGD